MIVGVLRCLLNHTQLENDGRNPLNHIATVLVLLHQAVISERICPINGVGAAT